MNDLRKSFRVDSAQQPVSGKLDGLEPKIVFGEEKGNPPVLSFKYDFPGFLFYYENEKENIFSVSNAKGTRNVAFTQIKIPGAGYLNEMDKPLLPSFGRYVQIPFDHTFDSKRVLWTKKLDLNESEDLTRETGGEILVKRSGYELSDMSAAGGGAAAKSWSRVRDDTDYEKDYFEKFYGKTKPYPAAEDIVDVTGPFLIDGYNALLVHVRPFRYANPRSVELEFFYSIHFEIGLKKNDATMPDNQECHAGAYCNLFLNPKRGIEDRMATEPPMEQKTAADGIELLIVYANPNLKGPVQRLARWKKMKGLETKICDATELGTGEKLIGNIKNKIVALRQKRESRLRYVLLFGDSKDLSPGNGQDSDYCYSIPEGCINGKLAFPWLSVGRIPVANARDAEIVVEQIIKYEKEPPEDWEYYKEMAFCAHLEDSASFQEKRKGRLDGRDSSNYVKTMEDISANLKCSVEKIYDKEKGVKIENYLDGSPVPQEVDDLLEDDSGKAGGRLFDQLLEGKLIVAHRGHGAASGWVKPSLETQSLPKYFLPRALPSQSSSGEEKVEIVPKPSIVFSINCMTGNFAGETECLGEILLKLPFTAPSLIAPARSSDTWLNNAMMKALFDSLWPGILPTIRPDETPMAENWEHNGLKHARLGDIMNYAKAYLPIYQSKADSKIIDHFEIYHVLGDPSLEVWRKAPANKAISVAEQNGVIEISCGGQKGFPEDLVVTVFTKDRTDPENPEKMARIRPEPGSKTFSWDILSSGLFPEEVQKICFHAPGYLFKEMRPDSETGKYAEVIEDV